MKRFLLVFMLVAFNSSVNATTVCQNPGVSDPDGDGWGWENGASCTVQGSTGGSSTSNLADVLAQLRALTNRVAVLESQVNNLSSNSSNTSNTNTTTPNANGQIPSCRVAHDRMNSQVTANMSMSQVRTVVGPPRNRSLSGNYEYWYYGDNTAYGTNVGPTITFRNGLVHSFNTNNAYFYCT